MARVVLHDDVPSDPLDPNPVLVGSLDQDVPLEEETEVLPLVTVRVRARTGWTDDGDPEFEWTDVVTAHAIVWEERVEIDEWAGVTRGLRRLVVLYDNTLRVDESAVVICDPGGTYRVTRSEQIDDRLEMTLAVLEDSDG